MLTLLYTHHAFYRPGVTKVSVVRPTPDMPYMNRSRTIATDGERASPPVADFQAYGTVTAVSFLAVTRNPFRFLLPYAWTTGAGNHTAMVSQTLSWPAGDSSSGPTPAEMSLFENPEGI